MRLWEKVGLMEISGNGQNMHFKFLPEGVCCWFGQEDELLLS